VKVVASIALVFSSFALGCEPASNTSTFVVLQNAYPASSGLVIYDAFWQAVSFEDAAPLPPGASSVPESTVPCSANTAYVVLAPGWDPAKSATPTTFVVLQSEQGYAVDVNDTVDIPVSDASFAGNCAAGSFLTQSQADFITQFVFSGDFAGLRYDAATCTTTAIGDAGAP
jgi:hypothetical protein